MSSDNLFVHKARIVRRLLVSFGPHLIYSCICVHYALNSRSMWIYDEYLLNFASGSG